MSMILYVVYRYIYIYMCVCLSAWTWECMCNNSAQNIRLDGLGKQDQQFLGKLGKLQINKHWRLNISQHEQDLN